MKTSVLTASGARELWTGTDRQPLDGLIRRAVRALTKTPGGLLVGVLPYPASPRPEATLPTIMHFASFDFSTGSDPGALAVLADDRFRLTSPFSADWPAPGYENAVRQVQSYLTAGDAYQVNLAQRFSASYRGDPYEAWLALQGKFTPPLAAWLNLGDRQILCLSPESFLDIEADSVLTKPIKGTRPRSPDSALDADLAADLASHPKDRAENLMIVDLLRNDLGRVCVPGSVRVPALFQIESFRNVHHLVSTVEGRLRPGIDIASVVAACFPGGSITGAPKRRAMEIIEELEPHPRDIYCGSIFWMTADGRFGSNITIRTFLARNGVLHGWAGAGIVADSIPEKEQQECLDKLAPLMRSMEEMFL